MVSSHEKELADPGMACVVLTVGGDIFFGELIKFLGPSSILLRKLVVLVAIVTKDKDGTLGVRLRVRIE